MAESHRRLVLPESGGFVDHLPERRGAVRGAMFDLTLYLAAKGRDEQFVPGAAHHGLCETLLKIVVLLKHEGLFRGEVGEERSDGHVGFIGHITDTYDVEAALQEEPQGRVSDLLASLGLFPLTASGRLGHRETLATHKTISFKMILVSVILGHENVMITEFGGPDVFQLVDAEEPHAGPGQIRITVRAAGVNPVDWRIREGQVLSAHPVVLPAGAGQDGAGSVDEVGEGVEGVEVGDNVFGRGSSIYAEFAVLSAWSCMPKGLVSKKLPVTPR